MGVTRQRRLSDFLSLVHKGKVVAMREINWKYELVINVFNIRCAQTLVQYPEHKMAGFLIKIMYYYNLYLFIFNNVCCRVIAPFTRRACTGKAVTL